MGSFRVGCSSLVVVVVHCVLCEREVLCVRAFWYCKIFSWVRRSTLQLGAQGGERREKEREICKLFYFLINMKVSMC
jgi:hypothetical protein